MQSAANEYTTKQLEAVIWCYNYEKNLLTLLNSFLYLIIFTSFLIKMKLYTKEQVNKKYNNVYVNVYPHHYEKRNEKTNSYQTMYEVRKTSKNIRENMQL
jgi:hypothetical protein